MHFPPRVARAIFVVRVFRTHRSPTLLSTLPIPPGAHSSRIPSIFSMIRGQFLLRGVEIEYGSYSPRNLSIHSEWLDQHRYCMGTRLPSVAHSVLRCQKSANTRPNLPGGFSAVTSLNVRSSYHAPHSLHHARKTILHGPVLY